MACKLQKSGSAISIYGKLWRMYFGEIFIMMNLFWIYEFMVKIVMIVILIKFSSSLSEFEDDLIQQTESTMK